ncbi:MAG TPA: hypothetical protein VGJ44_01520 [Kribbellaceae bacterium]
MTNPPPYGQQPGDGQAGPTQRDGFPQYGPGYPGPGTFSQPDGPPDSGQPGGFPSYAGNEPTLQLPRTAFGTPPTAPTPTPPRKDNTLQLLGIIAGVVTVLAIIGITAFVTPGFLVSHDDAGSTPSVQTAPPTEEPTDLPTQLPTDLPTQLPTDLPTELPSGLPTGPATGGPVVTAPTGKAAITAFLASVNAGNVKAALSRSCVSSRDLLQSTVTDAVQHHAKLQASGLDDNSLLVMGQLSGTVDGHPATGAVTATNFDQRGFCVSTFLAM